MDAQAAQSNSSAQVSPWRVAGAAVQGTSHARRDLPCQDAYRFRCLANGGLLIAVADGAGLARLSQFGANQAAEVGLDGLQAGLEVFTPESLADWKQP